MTTSIRFSANPIREATPAYVAAFALAADPFPVDPAQGVFVPLPAHMSALATFREWIGEMRANPGREERLGVITGQEGSGTSRLLAEMMRDIDDEGLHLVRLPDVPSHRTDAQLLKAILAAFGADPRGRTGLELRGEVQDVLQHLRNTGVQAGLLIDDADFKGSQLELVRNLLRDTDGTGFWIVLVGTPDLNDRMRRRRSLRGLMGPAIALDDQPETDLDALVAGRIAAERTTETPEKILPAASMQILATWSSGNPGRMLTAARTALILAARAGFDGVSLETARETVRRLMVAEANEARAAAAAMTGRPVQAPMPLPKTESSRTTTQRRLWNGEESV